VALGGQNCQSLTCCKGGEGAEASVGRSKVEGGNRKNPEHEKDGGQREVYVSNPRYKDSNFTGSGTGKHLDERSSGFKR